MGHARIVTEGGADRDGGAHWEADAFGSVRTPSYRAPVLHLGRVSQTVAW
jgi:hypothetical protein